MGDITFEIKERIAVLKAFDNGWNKELNVVCWNNGQDKYDVRDWNEDHSRMTRGITLTSSETKNLVDALRNRKI